jgi:parvulin-like peptidyl-prolyl isomerase
MKSRIAPLLFTLLTVSSQSWTQNNSAVLGDTVARIGRDAITVGELVHRIEMVPFPAIPRPADVEELKSKALYALIAEKVLAREANRAGLHEDDATKLSRRELENLFIRDALYKREVEGRAVPAEDETYAAMNRFRWELNVIAFGVRSEADGKALVKLLSRAKPDSVLRGLKPSMYAELDTIQIRFGGPDSAYENAAFTLGNSRVSKPFSSRTLGWSVLYLLDKRTNSQAARMNLDERRRFVQKVLKSRHAQEMGDQYSHAILGAKSATADSGVFGLLADSILALRGEMDPKYYLRKGGYMITSEMIDVLLYRLRPVLDTVFISIADGNMTLGEVLEMFRYENFTTKSLNGFPFKLELNEEVKHLVANEFLAREGRRQNLQYSAPVRDDIAVWSNYWAARQLYYAVRDSVTVTDEDVLQHLLKNKEFFGKYYEVNVREVLCRGLQDAATVVEELHQTGDFGFVAVRRSMRQEWSGNRGESGFFKILQHPELGFRALMADTGKLVGPCRLPEGYSLFTVLGKRRTKEAVVGFDTLEHNVRARLTSDRRKETTNRFIARLAEELQVSIDYKKLKAIKPTSIPMFTQRFMGFGGMMTAVPILMQQWDWIKEFQKKANVAF